MSGITVEWAPFTLAEGVSETDLLETSDAFQSEFLAGQDGFVRRELLHAGGREWCDLVYWRDPGAAERAFAKASGNVVCSRYFQLMVAADTADPSASVQHFALRRSYL